MLTPWPELAKLQKSMDVLSFDNTELDQFAKRSHQEAGLMLIDNDHLQQVNDPYGHEVGDKVIQQVATGPRR